MLSAQDPEERRRRRALLRAHHPDLGGDPARFAEVLARLERGRATGARPPADEVVFVRRRRGLRRLLDVLRRRAARRSHPSRVL